MLCQQQMAAVTKWAHMEAIDHLLRKRSKAHTTFLLLNSSICLIWVALVSRPLIRGCVLAMPTFGPRLGCYKRVLVIATQHDRSCRDEPVEAAGIVYSHVFAGESFLLSQATHIWKMAMWSWGSNLRYCQNYFHFSEPKLPSAPLSCIHRLLANWFCSISELHAL